MPPMAGWTTTWVSAPPPREPSLRGGRCGLPARKNSAAPVARRMTRAMILPARRLGALRVPPPEACRVGAPVDRPAEDDPDVGNPDDGEGGLPSEGDTAELPDNGEAGEAADAAGLAEGDAGATAGDAGAGAGAGSVKPLEGAALGGATTEIDEAVGSSNCWEKGS